MSTDNIPTIEEEPVDKLVFSDEIGPGEIPEEESK